jgi:hypothetical protein
MDGTIEDIAWSLSLQKQGLLLPSGRSDRLPA